MKPWIRTGTFWSGVVMVALGADQLTVTGKTHEGSFQSYEDNRFHFMTVKGRFVKEHASRVVKLVLEHPKKASYRTADAAKEETALFKGYDKRKFIFATGGKDIIIQQAKMKTIELIMDEGWAGAGGGEFGGNRYPIPQVDIQTLSRGPMTPAQRTALNQFNTAKAAYDEFVAKSSAMVAEMDRLTGAKREDLLNQLRIRKNEEQPLKNALLAAYKALTAAFAEAEGE